MTIDNRKRIHLIYGIVLSAMLVITGICLISACLGIYFSGDQPFSPESVATAFSPIAVPVWLTIILVIVGFLMDLVLPDASKKNTSEKQYSLILKRLQANADFSRCEESLRQAVFAQQKLRCIYRLVSGILLAVGSIAFLCYALQSDSFHATEINSSVIHAAAVLLACLAVPFLWAVFSVFRIRVSIRKEIELLKQIPKVNAKQGQPQTNTYRRALISLRGILLLAGMALALYGLFTGGTADVLTKAINICTECVGLG